MLTELHIRDFALIDGLHLQLGDGFNVLTGETGAGKSIIIDALNAVLGERMPAEAVRSGADRAIIEAVFDLSENPRARGRAEELGIEVDDGLVMISRDYARAGKSQCRVNGRLATLAMLKELTADLADIHGQHEHQSLLAVDKHIDIFDAWCGQAVLSQKGKVAEAAKKLRELKLQLENIQSDARERARMLDLYEFQRNEIDAARLQAGEEEELLSEKMRLANAEKLNDMATAVYDALAGGVRENGALDGISEAARQLEAMAALDGSVGPILENLETALIAAQEAQAAIRDYRERIESDPSRLEDIEERLDLIRTLKRKYGDTIEEINAYGAEVAKKIEDLTNSEETAGELAGQIEGKEKELQALASELTKMRKAAASEFSSAVVAELSDMAMKKTRFEVGMESRDISERGAEKIEFLISPNPGEPLKPLARIASGGEMSRVMLALKTVVAGADRVPTLVFDEIDTGIGGRTAVIIGEKLSAIARRSQVMCVTHLPQIASKAGTHLHVEKVVEKERTRVRVRVLNESERVEELARMLGGSETDVAIIHAREMLGV